MRGSFWPSHPGILPGHRDALVVSAIPNVVATVVTELQRLVFGYGDRGRCSNAGVVFLGLRVFDAVQTGFAAEPIIAVERKPEARLDVVTEMAFEGSDGVLGLGLGAGKVHVVREKLRILGEEPRPGVAIEHPLTPAFGIAELRFEAPAVGSPIDQFCRIVLTCRSHHFETRAEQYLLLPFCKLLRCHGGTALEVHGKPKG